MMPTRRTVLREGPRARRSGVGAALPDRSFERREGLPARRRSADARLPRAGREPRAARAAVALHLRRRAAESRPAGARPGSRPGVGLAECAEVARWARAILQDIGLEPFPVTSGSKGIHLYARLDGRQSSDAASAVAKELARAIEADHPDLVVSQMAKAARPGKVFIDWSQNNGSKTTIAPYSLRGRPASLRRRPAHMGRARRPRPAAPAVSEVLERPDDPLAPVDEAHGPLRAYISKRTAGKTPEPVPEAPHGEPDPEGSPASSSMSTTPAACTGISASNATACSSAGPCPRASHRRPRRTASPS